MTYPDHKNCDFWNFLNNFLTSNEVIEWYPKFKKIINDHDFVDNYRFACKNNIKDMEIYRDLAKKGCCGYYDGIFVINGKEYCFGFNYGH